MTPVRQRVFVATHPKGYGDCMRACLASVLDYPLERVLDVCTDEVRADWSGSIGRWLADRGLILRPRRLGDPRLAGVYGIGTGDSPRGAFLHAVVTKGDRVVFDPHPSDDGVTRLHHVEVLEALTEEQEALHLRGELWRRGKRKAAA